MSKFGKNLIKSLKKDLEDLKKDRPFRVTEYSTDKNGKLKRKVSIKRPSELKRKSP